MDTWGHRETEDVKFHSQINFSIHLKLFIFVYSLKFFCFLVYVYVFVLLYILNFFINLFFFVFVLCKVIRVYVTHPHKDFFFVFKIFSVPL